MPWVSNHPPGYNRKALSLWPGELLATHCVLQALCWCYIVHQGWKNGLRVKWSSWQPSWELLPVRWLLFHVLQAWSCARPWTVNQVKSKSCLTLWLIVNMPSGTSAQELDSDAGAGTGEPASFRRDSLFSPLFPFPPHPSPLQPFPLLPRFPFPSHPLLYPPLGIGLRLIQFGRGEPL